MNFLRTEINPIQWLMLALFVAFSAYTVFGHKGLYTYYSNRQTKQQLLQHEEELKLKVTTLKREIELLHEPKYLETVIRQELGYIKPGEVIFQQDAVSQR